MSLIIEPKKLEESDWEDLLSFIKNGQCILFVGPETVLKEPGVFYHQTLIQSASFKDNDEFSYAPRDEMFLLKKPWSRGTLVRRFRDYCNKNNFYQDTYKKIAGIPFQTIILMSRYAFLTKYFKDNNFSFQERWFSKTRTVSPDVDDPSSETPLLYNIFGKWEEDDSLLLTYDDLFSYLINLLGKTKPIDPKLKDIVQSSSQIIFLGFKFERWYIQLLLRLFELNKSDAKFQRTSTVSSDDEEIINICTTEFNMKFIDDNIESFIDVLYDKCINAGVKLREPTIVNSNKLLQDEFNKFMKESNFDAALKNLESLEVKNNSSENKSIKLRGRWSSLKGDRERMLPGEYTAQENGLRTDIITAFEQIMNNQ